MFHNRIKLYFNKLKILKKMKYMAYKTQQFLRKTKLFKKLKLIKKSNNITVFNTSKEVLFIKKCLLLGRMNQSY